MKFVVFNADGDALRAGNCPEDALAQQAGEGETVFEWQADMGSPVDWRVVDGELTRR